MLDQTCALLKAVASTRDFALLDGLTEMRFNCTRRMGELLLAGAERVPGVDADIAEQCCKRARLADSEFAALVSKAQFMQRRRAGEPPSPRAAQRSGAQLRRKRCEALGAWKMAFRHDTLSVLI